MATNLTQFLASASPGVLPGAAVGRPGVLLRDGTGWCGEVARPDDGEPIALRGRDAVGGVIELQGEGADRGWRGSVAADRASYDLARASLRIAGVAWWRKPDRVLVLGGAEKAPDAIPAPIDTAELFGA